MTSSQKQLLFIRRIDFDYSVLPTAKQRGAEKVVRAAIADYVRQLFGHLDGVVETLTVDHRRIEVSWVPGPSNPSEAVVAMLKEGQLAEAILLLRFFLSAAPDDPVILYNLGMALSDTKKIDEAIRLLHHLLEVEPNHVDGRVALGVAYSRTGNLEEATAELRRAVADDPSNPWAHRNLAACLMKLDKLDEGVKHFRKATELNPMDTLAWLGLAQALEIVKDATGADEAFRQVLVVEEYGPTAKLAQEGLSRLAQQSFRAAAPSAERPDAVMYCLTALQKFDRMPVAEVQKIAFEIAVLGSRGLSVNDPTKTYFLNSLPGEFTGLQLVCLMYVGFKQFAPEQDVGFDLAREYEMALQLHEPPEASE